MRRTRHLFDDLERAVVHAPGPGHVEIQPVTIRRETRTSLFQHPTSDVTFRGVALGAKPVLELGVGLKQSCWDRVRSPVEFRVRVRGGRWSKREVFRATVDATAPGDGRRWHDASVDLSRFAGKTVDITFATAVGGSGDGGYAWAAWSDPSIVDEVDATAPAVRGTRTAQRNVVLITSDALRADHVGCAEVATPHLDALAKEGCSFSHARAQSPVSLGSSATIATGRDPVAHGVISEWGRVRPGVTTLAGHLRALGWHTVVAMGEAEAGVDSQGLVSEFEDLLPCLGNPSQDGGITTRQFERWLDRRSERPFFAWLQYFDTHPPATPPEPFRSMYYDGDPSDPARTHRPEDVRAIRGIETILAVEPLLGELTRGVIDPNLIDRLDATAKALRSGSHVGPDLATHLRALGPSARRGMGVEAFADWLAAETATLRAGKVGAELVPWLREAIAAMRLSERDILGWLDGVVDFRYPLAQYRAAVSYVDDLVGRIAQALKDRGIYDETTILFTAPHGELLGASEPERGEIFQHYGLFEATLRVPLVVKPARGACRGPGARVGGVLDLCDVAPTLLDAVGASPLARSEGVSRWRHVVDGTPIPEHVSVALDFEGTMVAASRPPYVLLRAITPGAHSQRRIWTDGESEMYVVDDTSPYAKRRVDGPAAVREELEAATQTWATRLREHAQG